DFGIWNTNLGAVARHRMAIGGQNVRLLFNIVPEAASYLGERTLADIAKSTVFNGEPDAICVSGLTAGAETSADQLRIVKDVLPNTPVFANTGVRVSNVKEQLSVADGAVVGTAFKRDGHVWNEVQVARVREFMAAARDARG
ncbi:MAG: SgcQ protein, partial [Spirochaetaceae bacterium]